MSFVLDTSSILTYLTGKKGSSLIEELLDKAILKEASLYINYLAVSELYYLVGSELEMSKANEVIATIRRWPVKLIEVNESIALAAGRLMIKKLLSIQDAISIATAIDKKASLITSNPKLVNVYGDVILIGESPKDQ